MPDHASQQLINGSLVDNGMQMEPKPSEVALQSRGSATTTNPILHDSIEVTSEIHADEWEDDEP